MKLAKFTVPFLAALMLVGTTATPCAAQETTALWTWSSPSAIETEPWRFSVNGYGWLPSAPVTIKIKDKVVGAPEKFSKILDDLEFAAMGEAEVHKGPFGAFVSPMFYKGKDKENFTGLLGASRNTTLEQTGWLIDYGVSYDLGVLRLGKKPDSPTVTLQPYGGARFLHDEIKLDISPGAIGPGVKFRDTLSFNTPIIGFNTLWNLTDRWILRIGGDYGGFDVDDVKETYQFVGLVGYRFELWGKSAKVFAGYRWVHVEYEKTADIKVTIKGPLVGMGFDF